MQLNTRHFYEFGPFQLDPAERLLLCDEKPVSLSPKGFELLVFLVMNHGRLVTKDQIFNAVWTDSFVEESNLTVSISALRRALREKKGGLQYIETVTKAGYRFVAPVEEREMPAGASVSPRKSGELAPTEWTPEAGPSVSAGTEADLESVPIQYPSSENVANGFGESLQPYSADQAALLSVDPRRRWTLERISLALVLAILLLGAGYRLLRRSPQGVIPRRPQSLAILPFQNLSHDSNSDFLGFSLADAVITKLGSVSALTVRPSSAIEKYRDQVIDIQKVGADLEVDTLLTGNVIREGDDLRITPQLIDVKSNRILWKGTIDLKYDNLLAVQDKVAQEILKGLALNLTLSEAERLRADAPSNSLAYEYYLRGVDLYSRGDFPMAIKMLEKSAEIDPNYALTWAQMGTSYTAQASLRFGGREQYRKAQSAYEKALALEPAQLETRIYMANLLTDTGQVEQAVPLLREALKTNPNNADLHWELGYAYRFGGMLRQSVEESEWARRIDPSVKLTTSAANGYLYLGQYDKFLQTLPNNNDSAFILFYRGLGEFYKKNNEQAARDFDRAFERDPSLLQANIGKVFSYAIKKQQADALDILQATEKRIEERGVGDPEAIYKLAQAYAVLGDKQSALRMLRQSIANGFFPYSYFKNDPMLEGLRNEAEFTELMSATRQRQEAFKSAFF